MNFRFVLSIAALVLVGLGLWLLRNQQEPSVVPRSGFYHGQGLLVVDRENAPITAHLLANAKKSIHIALYRIDDELNRVGSKTNQLIQELLRAVQRGVKVRVILDNNHDNDRRVMTNRMFASFLQNQGVLTYLASKAETVHAKFMVVDQKDVFVTAANWAHNSFERDYDLGILFDSPTLAEQVVHYWHDLALNGRVPPSSDNTNRILKGFGKYIALHKDLPPRTDWAWEPDVRAALAYDRGFERRMKQAIDTANENIFIGQYVLQFHQRGDSVYRLIEHLKRAANRSVRVRVKLQNDPQNLRWIKLLEEAGMEAYLDADKASLHSKFVVIDGRYSMIGSTNWIPPALDISHELSLLIDSVGIARQVREYWDNIPISKDGRVISRQK